jgi:diaminopimelate epimerase
VAAALIGVAQHGLKFPVHVKTVKGYDLVVDGEFKDGAFHSVTLTGPVKKVYEGVIDWDALDILYPSFL